MFLKVYEITLKSKVEEVRKVEHFVQRIAKENQFSEDFVYNVMIIITEAANNAVIHGNKLDEEKKARLKCGIQLQDAGKESLVIEVIDEGDGFDPNNLPNPLAEENLLKPSGRGVFLMKQFAHVEFEFGQRGTTVRMKMDIA
ncbi:putative anti-sigma regulatory factor, serine/threonine protein kinase [Chloroherpeton thalassium ATCC 35110]|uniref:Putative anti-sigma regulatory factor, serine/threonine protein kinase n=1 Tax=Chloroherpeton thalassium (strain ATCC 35110 / GB-78) TaxID=517418 RepID=B3QSM5_CHLT3|nr:putative anti-sigma regulatory factor, serine/threonine protein kinase [Chloroherpeton thalassium ATCC 35110]